MSGFLRWLANLFDPDTDVVLSIVCPACGEIIWLPKNLAKGFA